MLLSRLDLKSINPEIRHLDANVVFAAGQTHTQAEGVKGHISQLESIMLQSTANAANLLEHFQDLEDPRLD